MDTAHHRRRCSISTASRVSFDGFRALNKLSLAVEPGEMRAIIGPNGAGKTTMMDVVTGKTRPDDGDVYFDGELRSHRASTRPRSPSSASAASSRSRPCSTCTRSRTISLLALKSDRARARDAVLARRPPRRRAASNSILDIIRLSTHARPASPAPCRTARSSGSRSACCWRRSRSSCWSTSRSPA